MKVLVIAAAIVSAGCQQSSAQQTALPRVEQIDGDRVHTLRIRSTMRYPP